MQDSDGDEPEDAFTSLSEGPPVREATELLRDFLASSEQFSRMLGDELDVNATDFRAMEHLLSAGALTPGELARRLDLSSSAITTSIDRLSLLGHVTRGPDPADRRRVRVVPAPNSADRAARIIGPMIRALDAELDGFSEADQAAITAYLRGVVARMREHAEPRPDE